MPSTFNLALIPTTKSAEIISFAQHFKNFSATYQLSQRALPHVTLYHFKYAETKIIDCWRKATAFILPKTLLLNFENYSLFTKDNISFCISLMPNQLDILHNLHQQVASLLHLPIKKNFDPHMTLCNSTLLSSEKHVQVFFEKYKPIADNFVLSLGRSDPIGQLTEIIFKVE